MDLVGKMDLVIVYQYGNVKFDRTITSEDKLKEFINELIELRADGTFVKVLEVYNNLGY